jgi:hypothetical protein
MCKSSENKKVQPCPNVEPPVPVPNPPKDPRVGVCFTPKPPNPPNPRRQI